MTATMPVKTISAEALGMNATEWQIYQAQPRMGRVMMHYLRDHLQTSYQQMLRSGRLEAIIDQAGRSLAIKRLRQKRSIMANNPPMGADGLSRMRWEGMANEMVEESLPVLIETVVQETVFPMINAD